MKELFFVAAQHSGGAGSLGGTESPRRFTKLLRVLRWSDQRRYLSRPFGLERETFRGVRWGLHRFPLVSDGGALVIGRMTPVW